MCRDGARVRVCTYVCVRMCVYLWMLKVTVLRVLLCPSRIHRTLHPSHARVSINSTPFTRDLSSSITHSVALSLTNVVTPQLISGLQVLSPTVGWNLTPWKTITRNEVGDVVHVYVCMYMCVCVCVRACVCMCVCKCRGGCARSKSWRYVYTQRPPSLCIVRRMLDATKLCVGRYSIPRLSFVITFKHTSHNHLQDLQWPDWDQACRNCPRQSVNT